ncbi:MAG: hypothetical protein ACR2RB_21055 [Gammaproteobacteria bacterium]
MARRAGVRVTIAMLVLTGGNAIVSANGDDGDGVACRYALENSGGQPGKATVIIKYNKKLKIKFRGTNPDTLYTVWIDHKSRATGELAPDYPLADGALGRGVAPAFATDAVVTSGVGLDPNGIITDEDGDARFKVKLDYNLLAPGSSPVVGGGLAMQGLNRVGGGWLREYPQPTDAGPSTQIALNGDRTVAKLPRSTAQGITIVRHGDGDYITHGHTPGVGNVDHFSAFKGDFPPGCLR